MQTGLFLALISCVVFAAGIVLVRKTAGEAGEAFSVTAFSIFTGVPFFVIAISAAGQWYDLAAITVKALVMLMAAGLIHFIVGRLLAYESWRLIGANRGSPFTQTSPIYTIILSWIFLDERLTAFVAVGAVCMLVGALLITREKQNLYGEKRQKFTREEIKGILFALGAGLCWGVTPVLIKPSVEAMHSPAAASFVAYVTAALAMGVLLLNRARRQRLAQLSFKKNILPMVVAGLFTAAGQLLYFTALDKSPANVIAPLMSIQILFIFVFSFLVNRKIELFTWKVALGMAAAVAGTVLLFR